MNNVNAKFIINDTITFKYAKGVSAETGKEFHTFHEIIYFMGGTGKFISENIQVPLKPNTLIIIPKETYHQFIISGSQTDYHRCVFHFLDIPDLKEFIDECMNQTLLIEMNQQLDFLFRQMILLTKQERTDIANSIVMQSILALILNEISSQNYININPALPDTISDKCVDYISKHISDSISVEDIASELNISASHLAHTFKKQMNISLHQYILKKKLVVAHHKISDGIPATKAAADCGFNDYSGFYKQFKKMFNKSPSERGNGIDVE